METKLNIAEILKDKPKGTKLYSPLFGNVCFSDINDSKIYALQCNNRVSFYKDGCYFKYKEAEPLLFPSKEMRDWYKFAWKKGDVLESMEGSKILFDKWASEDYTKFLGKIKVLGNSHCYDTAYYTLASKEEALEFIKSVEEINNGKLNLETLEIEKAQPEFKDGDILYITDRIVSCNFIMIYKNQEGDRIYHYATLPEDDIIIMTKGGFLSDNGGLSKRYATEEEKQQLFDALAKKGKAWDTENKQIVDLKPKWTPKPFDRVITRTPNTPWTANFFSHIDSDGVKNCIDDRYLMCLPYNEETAKLIGTTNNAK